MTCDLMRPIVKEASATFKQYIVSIAVNVTMTMNSFQWPIIDGCDSVEGYSTLLKLFLVVSTMV